MDERPNRSRHRVCKAGTIEFGGGAIDGTVRNFSYAGAALDVSSPIGIPEHFTLFVQVEAEHRHCTVVWRKVSSWQGKHGCDPRQAKRSADPNLTRERLRSSR
jgi:hypothetical protein